MKVMKLDQQLVPKWEMYSEKTMEVMMAMMMDEV